MSDAKFYDEIYMAKPNMWVDPWRDAFALGVVSKYLTRDYQKVLDYGCGNGHTLAFFRDYMPDHFYYGLDISPVALRLAHNRIKNGEFFTTIPDDHKFNFIIIMGTAEHFEDPAKTLAEIAEYLEEGGMIYLEVPNCLGYSDSKEEGFRKTFEGADQDEWHLKRSSWEKIIDEAGLEIFEKVRGPMPTYEYVWILRKKDERPEMAPTGSRRNKAKKAQSRGVANTASPKIDV